MNHISPTPAELDAMTYDEIVAHAKRELEALPPGSHHIDDLIEAFEMLLFQKQTGIPGIFKDEPEGPLACK